MNLRRMVLALAVSVLALIFSGCLGAGESQEAYENSHPAETANNLCASHGGVDNVSVYRGWFQAATCKDGTAVEVE